MFVAVFLSLSPLSVSPSTWWEDKAKVQEFYLGRIKPSHSSIYLKTRRHMPAVLRLSTLKGLSMRTTVNQYVLRTFSVGFGDADTRNNACAFSIAQ